MVHLTSSVTGHYMEYTALYATNIWPLPRVAVIILNGKG
jgi:hypothetical protein